MNSDNRAMPPIPDHVPAERVVDFNYWEMPEGIENPFDVWDDIARRTPEIFYTPHNEGHWVIRGFEGIYQCFRDIDAFSTAPQGIPARRAGPDKLIPVEIDPPQHQGYRLAMAPLFSPASIRDREPRMRALVNGLVDEFIDRGHCDFVGEFSLKFPTAMFLEIAGLPVERLPEFMGWELAQMRGETVEIRTQAWENINNFVTEFVDSQTADSATGLLGQMLRQEGYPWTRPEIANALNLLFVAGLDTVANTLSFIWMHLARHPDSRRYILDHPDRVADVAEELLRYYAVPTGLVRRARRDVEFRGVHFKSGDAVMLAPILANRDELVFDAPHELRFDREVKSNLTFGAGPHRCIGSHLAKREIIIALEEWLPRIPEFTVQPGKRIRATAGQVMGLEELPLSW